MPAPAASPPEPRQQPHSPRGAAPEPLFSPFWPPNPSSPCARRGSRRRDLSPVPRGCLVFGAAEGGGGSYGEEGAKLQPGVGQHPWPPPSLHPSPRSIPPPPLLPARLRASRDGLGEVSPGLLRSVERGERGEYLGGGLGGKACPGLGARRGTHTPPPAPLPLSDLLKTRGEKLRSGPKGMQRGRGKQHPPGRRRDDTGGGVSPPGGGFSPPPPDSLPSVTNLIYTTIGYWITSLIT